MRKLGLVAFLLVSIARTSIAAALAPTAATEHEAWHSVAVPNVIVKSGVCLGVRISSIPPGLDFAVVHGHLAKDK